MHPSQYNIYSAEHNGCFAIYNTATQNLVITTSEEKALIEAGVIFDEEALRLGLIVSDDRDERKSVMRYRQSLRSQGKSRLAVTIVPSKSCNFSCGYCYNGIAHRQTRSSAFDAAHSYIARELKPQESLHLTWYGGEPTLYLDKIRDFTKSIQKFCERNDSMYSADLLTNASTLTKNQANILSELSLVNIQVSIDWPLAKSQRVKPGLSVGDTLVDCLTKCNNIPEAIALNLRINVMPGFLDTFHLLLDTVEKLVSRPKWVYIHRIVESNDPTLNTKESSEYRYADLHLFFEDYYKARLVLRERGFDQEFVPSGEDSGYCIAQTVRDVIFTEEGEARKCVRELYGDGAMVDVSTGSSNGRYKFYMTEEVEENDYCFMCKFLPICHSGCVKEKYERPDDIIQRCTPWKFILERELTNYLISVLR